jgi:hypothetical protein
MRKFISTSLLMCLLSGGLTAPAALAQKNSLTANRGGYENRPKIRQAINALENARKDLQNAAHEFCGHRAEALEATNRAIEQLRRALESVHAMNAPGAPSNLELASDVRISGPVEEERAPSPQRRELERHPLIRRAIEQLEVAKIDLREAAHDFHGHRAEALESVDRALAQLRAALDCAARN